MTSQQWDIELNEASEIIESSATNTMSNVLLSASPSKSSSLISWALHDRCDSKAVADSSNVSSTYHTRRRVRKTSLVTSVSSMVLHSSCYDATTTERVESRQGRQIGRHSQLLLQLAATTVAIFLFSSPAQATEVPPGLLFASEMNIAEQVPPLRHHQKPQRQQMQQQQQYQPHPSEAQQYSRKIHPIRSIYHTNSHIRRLMEQIENDMPYFQTGIRGDKTHIISYRNHPFDSMRKSREEGHRILQDGSTDTNTNDASSSVQEDPFKPIRIHFDTSSIDADRTTSNAQKVDFVKNVILPRMQEFWSSAISVVPVEGNLLISTADLQGRVYCGDSEFAKVPTSHISTGVADADLILYVSGIPSTRFCGPSTLAVAVACNFDQFDRPIAGAINFCLDQIEINDDGLASESIIEDNTDVAIHEAAHVLGMSSNSYRFFWDPETGTERTYRPFSASTVVCVDGVERTLILPSENTMKFFIATNGQRYASIVTPKVATVARNQFNCQELSGAQLENQPTSENSCTGDHWDERMFYPELLSGVISPTTNYLSPLTLALLEDSGWYKANYTKAHVSPWGHGVGCDFVSSPCLVGGGNGRDGSIPSYSKGYFCNKASSRGCSPGYTHKMACTVIDYSLRGDYYPDAQFQYFADSNIGGPKEGDYCPVYGSVYSGLKAEQLDCRISSNDDAIDVIYSEEYGENSMCFETTSGEGRCYNARCIYEDFNLQVQVDGKWYTCKEDFEQIEVSTLSGAFGTTVTCPRLSSVCPDMFCPANCAGRGECIFGSSKNGGKSSKPRCKCFDESDTSAGCSDTFVLDGKYLRDGSGLTDKIKTSFFEPLIAVFVDHPDTWTSASWAWAAALFVVFMLMILCICSSFWPEKESKRPNLKKQRFAV